MNKLVLRVIMLAKVPDDSTGMTYSRRVVSRGEVPVATMGMAKELEDFFRQADSQWEYETELCVRVLKSMYNGGYVLVPVRELQEANKELSHLRL